MMCEKFMTDDRTANWAQTHLQFHATPFFFWKQERLVRMQSLLLSFQK
jgi:hypothetical protein